MVVRELAPSVEALLARTTGRRPFANPDGRSTAAFEHVWLDGAPHVVKYLDLDHDFIMRASGDIGCRTVRAWLRDTAALPPARVRLESLTYTCRSGFPA